VPALSERKGAGHGVANAVALRAPHLYTALRAFALDAFRLFSDDDLPFAFEEHVSVGRPALYEYRPLVARDSRNERTSGRYS